MTHTDRIFAYEKYKNGEMTKEEEVIFVHDMYMKLYSIRSDVIELSNMQRNGPCSAGMSEAGNYLFNKFLR